MPKTLEEQIAGKCIHFTGIMDKTCKKGVEYDSFGKVKLNVIPCLSGGTAHCEFCEFPSADQVKKQLAEIAQMGTAAIKILGAAKTHYKINRQAIGVFKCPMGDHAARYVRAASNGHFWISCKTCQLTFNE